MWRCCTTRSSSAKEQRRLIPEPPARRGLGRHALPAPRLPAAAQPVNQTAVTMMLFGMINWTFTLRPGGGYPRVRGSDRHAMPRADLASDEVAAHELATPGRPRRERPSRGAAQYTSDKRGAHVVVMGVAGCGKSAVGQRLAQALGLPLVEGRRLSPQAQHPQDAAGHCAHRRRPRRLAAHLASNAASPPAPC